MTQAIGDWPWSILLAAAQGGWGVTGRLAFLLMVCVVASLVMIRANSAKRKKNEQESENGD